MEKICFVLEKYALLLLARLPFRVLYIISDLLYPIIYYVVKYRKKVVFENLQNSFPEKTEEELEIIAQKFYRHFCDLLVEAVKLFAISEKELVKRMKFRNPELFQSEFERGKHVMVVLGHYNNWEWGVGLGLQTPLRFASIYKPLTNKQFDKLMIKTRTRFGGEVISMSQAGRAIVQRIRDGKLTAFNFIADQSPYRTDVQYWTTFLNQDTPVYIGIEKLSHRIGQPVYFANFTKIKRGYYEVVLEKLCDNSNDLKPNELTEMHVKALEKEIRQAPEYWLWSHRRWKVKKDE